MAREREIYTPGDSFGRWKRVEDWHENHVRDTALFMEESAKFINLMKQYIEDETAAQWIEEEGDPAGIIAKSEEEMVVIAAFVEEATRWETPVKHFMRTAVEDTEIAGQKIRKDDYIYVSYASANRDDAVFDNPFTFDHKRTPNKQLAYGYGAHVCLGQHLARMEMRILWEELLPHIKSIEPTGEPKRMAANFVSGPKSVPIRFTAA